MSAKGAIACGHPATAAAAREILEDGGNAFDAALAALCAACVAEPVLCSLGGGGYLLARRADGEAVLYDFFVETPLQRRDAAEIDFYPILADFGTATQEFHIGLGAIATPGAVKGLFAAHADLASLPMARLVEPAARMAREGVPLRPVDSYLFQVVGPILTARPEGRAVYTRPDGSLLAAPDAFRQPELAEALEALAREGEALFHEGEFGRQLVADCRGQGGQITMADLAAYRVVKRRPLERRHRDTRILTNPPPSSGGILIAFALELLAQTDLTTLGFGTAEHLTLLARVMELTNKARVESRLHEAFVEDQERAAAERLFDPALLARYAAEVEGQPASTRGTTHISVVDADGNIAALSISNGEGCGYILPGTGIMMNNMLGEEDLNPHGFQAWPEGCRMSSMMSPTVAYRSDGSITALGSGGSNRIRTAILQVLLNLIDFDLPIAEAVAAPRLHFENGIANLEEGFDARAGAALRDRAREVVPWPPRNLFFGGVHAVLRDAEGRLEAAGDPRRGGTAVIV
ncbi:MAG: gamma-glutamyltransferase [Proteobacteria bacterium]|nr:gamma-glutamyltransferase [Pseudomonadota bacterium]